MQRVFQIGRIPAVRHHAVILLVAGLVFFTRLGAAALFDEDEPKNAVCGREMFLRGDWIVPTFNHELRTDKPILIYWIMLCSYSVFGVNEFAARFGSSALAVTTAVLVYHIGRKLFDRETGLWGGVILCTCLMYSAVGRAVTPDSMLIFSVTATFLAYVCAVRGWTSGSKEVEFTPTWRTALPIGLCMGLAILAKGPVGIVLPTTVLGLFVLIQQHARPAATPGTHSDGCGVLDTDSAVGISAPLHVAAKQIRKVARAFHPTRIWNAFWTLKLPVVWGVAIAVALPWYLAVGWATEGDWLAGFLGGHNVGRFLKPMENHSGPIVYYVPVILLGTFPWSVFLPAALWNVKRSIPGHRDRAGLVFLVCWAGVWVTFFSCASTKLPNYVLPSYPALALLLGWFVQRWQESADSQRDAVFRVGCRLLAAVATITLIAIPIALHAYLPSEMWLTVIGLPPLLGAIAASIYSMKQQRPFAVRSLAVSAACLAVLVVGIAPASVSRHQDAPRFRAVLHDLFPDQTFQLGTCEYFTPNLVFYAADKVHRLKHARIAAFFDENPRALLLTRADRIAQLKPGLPHDVVELARQKRFLRDHDLVLLGRPTIIASAHRASEAATQ